MHHVRNAFVGLAIAMMAPACGNDEMTDGDGPDACVSDRDFFEGEVWGKVMGQTCVACHSLAGPAAEQQSKFLLQPTAYPGFLDQNFANARTISAQQIGGVSELLLKPLGEQAHGGGPIFDQASPQYAILEEFVARSAAPSQCEDAAPATLADIEQLDGPHTLRKAMLLVAARLPTLAEQASVATTEEAALDASLDIALEQAMSEPAFYDWIIETYNDVFLVDRYLSFGGRGTGLLNGTFWPNAPKTNDTMMTSTLVRDRANLAVSREPLQLIAHIVRQNRPFTEILTADYTVVNPYSEYVYGITNTAPADTADQNVWREVQLTNADGTLTLPHAGVLSSPMWLNRFPTTNTNRNRHRARMVFEQFLATDILAIADRPVDAAESTAFPNPTREDPSCKSCHSQIDPIAGDFQKWNNNDQELWQPTTNWFPEMYPAGYGGQVLDTAEYPRALPWLAEQIVADPRFAISVTRTVFSALTGQQTLEYPKPGAEHFDAHRVAFTAQDAVLARIAADFIATNYDFRTVVKGVVKSVYFRAANLAAEVEGDAAILVGAMGTARFATPEQLSRKVAAVTGMPWARSTTDRRSQLVVDYRIAFGGIDSDLIVDRLSAPNGMMSGVAWRMANEVACLSTAYDFTKPSEARSLFPGIAVTDVPEIAGTVQPEVEAKVRQALVHLHEQVLGEVHTADDADITRAWTLWLETWREGKAAMTAGTSNANLNGQCRGRWDATGAELPAAQRVETDPDFTIRSWMAVMTYLLADYRFLHL